MRTIDAIYELLDNASYVTKYGVCTDETGLITGVMQQCELSNKGYIGSSVTHSDEVVEVTVYADKYQNGLETALNQRALITNAGYKLKSDIVSAYDIRVNKYSIKFTIL